MNYNTHKPFVKYYRTALKLVFLAGLFFLPFIFWPYASIQYEIPRVWFVQRWIEVIGIIGLIVSLRSKDHCKIDHKLLALVLSLVSIAFISSLFGADLNKSIWGNYYRADGLFTLFHLIALFFFLALFWEENWQIPTAVAISLGAIGVSLVNIFLAVRLYILGDSSLDNWHGALGATFGQPNFLAGYLVVTLPFLYLLYKRHVPKRWPNLWLIAIVLQILAIVLTHSLGGLLSVVLFIIVLLIFKISTRIKSAFLVGAGFFLGLAFLASLLSYQNTQFVPESRERIFHKVILGTLQRPILGWGWANVDYAFESGIWPIPYQHDVYVDKAHSTLLEVFATAGIVGLAIYLSLLIYIGRRLWQAARQEGINHWWHQTLFLVFLLYVFHSQTNVTGIAEEVIFWLIVGLIAVEPTPARLA